MLSFLPAALRRDLPQQDVSVLLLDGSNRLAVWGSCVVLVLVIFGKAKKCYFSVIQSLHQVGQCARSAG